MQALTSQQRYLPFGEERAIPNSPILATDFGYTGQRLLDSGMGGIMDYRARFYSPALGRFLQPDSIIPNPANPQSWNRYSYVLNRPLIYIDPSGHTYMCGEACEANLGRPQYSLNDMAALYGVTFNPGWSVMNKAASLMGVYKAAMALQNELNSAEQSAYEACMDISPTSDCTSPYSYSAAEAFKGVYGNLNFNWCNNCVSGGFGWAYDDHTIMFDGMYTDFTQATLLVVHELGHLLDRQVCAARVLNGGCDNNSLFNNSARSDLSELWNSVSCGDYQCLSRQGHNGPNDTNWGFAGGWEVWQFGATDGPGEVWADMFLAWVYGQWSSNDFGSAKSAYMNQHMPSYITGLIH